MCFNLFVEVLEGVDERFEGQQATYLLLSKSFQVHPHSRKDPKGLQSDIKKATEAAFLVADSEFGCQIAALLNVRNLIVILLIYFIVSISILVSILRYFDTVLGLVHVI